MGEQVYKSVARHGIGNGRNRGTAKLGEKVVEISKKVQERRLKSCVGRSAVEIEVQGRRERGMPKRRWFDRVRDDIRENGLSGEEMFD